MSIPPIIHQIFIAADTADIDANKERLKAIAEPLCNLYPEWEYRLWGSDEIESFIKEHFDDRVLNAYRQLAPYSYKCDLARYCLLYIHGGLYADLATRFLNRLDIPHGVGLVAFTDLQFQSASWTATCPGIVFAHPGRRECQIAIEQIVENCRHRFYGRNSLYPTGPVLFGHALVRARSEKSFLDESMDDQWIGSFHHAPDASNPHRLVFEAPDKTIVAERSKLRGADLEELGLSGTNNYVDLWDQRKAYCDITLTWNARDKAIQTARDFARSQAGLELVSNRQEILTYGPYIDLSRGEYVLAIDFEGPVCATHMGIELAHHDGAGPVCFSDHRYSLLQQGGKLKIHFPVAEPLETFEFRIVNLAEMNCTISRFTIAKTSGN